MPNIKAIIEYDGTEFHGFQKQPRLRTVQGELESSLANLFKERAVKVIGAGRTDAGVHATGQVINFAAPEGFPVERICLALNSRLPETIRAKAASEVPEGFHARYSAKARVYIYVVLNREASSAILARYVWHVMQPLDVEVMRQAAEVLVGRHDFVSFGLPDKPGSRTEREIYGLTIERRKDAILFKIKADGFLRGMARSMVAALVEAGRGRRSVQKVAEILAACDRRAGGKSAPPKGLFLTKVEY